MVAFVDANIVVYASGRSHPQRDACLAVLAAASREPGACLASAEVLQEIFHIYLRRGDLVQARLALANFAAILRGNIVAVLPSDVLWAANADLPLALQSRDRIHLAVMHRLRIATIISADRSFDGLPGIVRLDPLDFESWRAGLFTQ